LYAASFLPDEAPTPARPQVKPRPAQHHFFYHVKPPRGSLKALAEDRQAFKSAHKPIANQIGNSPRAPGAARGCFDARRPRARIRGAAPGAMRDEAKESAARPRRRKTSKSSPRRRKKRSRLVRGDERNPNLRYADPELYSYGALPPMLHSTQARYRPTDPGEAGPPAAQYGIHPVDSVDVTHPSSLTNQTKYRVKVKPWENRSLAMISAISDGEHVPADVAPWDSTIRKPDVGLWRPPERHRAV
jgi:hypothetical protein